MAWRIEFGSRASRALKGLDRQVAARVVAYLEATVEGDPRARGKALSGTLTGLWRYRVGDWRVICRIENERLIVLVVDIGHRGDVYR